MSVFDRYGNFVYLNDGSLSSEEEAEEEKKRQEQLCELMSMYQHYRGIVAEPQYVPRGSKLRCQYGTEFVQLDCLEDYGIYRGMWTLLTTLDCRPENIHNFGSCLCPEANYRNRLPMTVANTVDGKTAIKAIYNEFPHICIPLVDEENGWRQVKKDLLVEANAHRDASVLLSNAVLVCQYGGIITVEEVLETEEEVVNERNNEKYVVIPKVLNVRSEASIQSEIIDQLEAKDRVYVTGNSKEEKTDDGIIVWTQIEYEGEEGWVDDSNILLDRPIVTENFPASVTIEILYNNGSRKSDVRCLSEKWYTSAYIQASGDTEGRYNIAIGPRIMNPKYKDDGEILEEDFLAFSRCVDVVIKKKEGGQQRKLECYVFMWKAHTYNTYNNADMTVTANVENGIFQTGIRYPNAKNNKEWAEENDDGSVVEFVPDKSYIEQKEGIKLEEYELVSIKVYLEDE